MKVSLPDAPRSVVERQVAERGYGTTSESLRDLIRQDQDRQALRALLPEAAGSAPGGAVDAGHVAGLRQRARQARRG